MEFILPEQLTVTSRQWCVVYDERDGRVVHVHEFSAIDTDCTCSSDELAEQALSQAVSSADRSCLKVLHPPSEMLPDPSANFRVNLEDGVLEVLERSPDRERRAPSNA